MKYVTRIAAGFGCALMVGTAVFGAGQTASASPSPECVVARVNGVAITQASLDAALAASGQRDSAALRHELKRRLIAWELLRQAAAKAQQSAPEAGAGPADASAPHAEEGVLGAHEIGSYLRAAVHPAAVTDADVRLRYAALARAHAAGSTGAGGELPEFGALAGTLRERLAAERFDEAVRKLAEQLMNEADIGE